MSSNNFFDVIIGGGGLAGLVSAIELSRAGLKVALIEKKQYPFHRVCGEYVSNEVKPYLQRLGVNFNQLAPSTINSLRVSSLNGEFNLFSKLQMGGLV
ncbi:MAG: FAD-binding protein [Bacteroidetes bacterium]|nr:FAD-binding protein [Bacteroidota bacterium]HET6244555.1 FAD-dependent oxidoreductase [Bacteroidia bacterium]